MTAFFIISSQILSYFAFYFIRRVWYRAEFVLPENFGETKKGILLVANHQSKSDPFIVLSYIPFSVFLRVLPIRFPVTHKYMGKAYLPYILKILGCYDIGETSRENMIGFLHTRRLLKEGKTVFLFPEGKISKNGNKIANLKRGIEFFTKESKSVIFVRIKGFNKKWQIFSAKGRSVTFGPAQNLNNKNVSAKDVKMTLNQL